ncbi:MAG: Fe-S cluster assembly ATPase SufC [Calditrichaeota bacterium]|jgi:Fe-S cluster assembly ATP-binding protein|nr:Fe-S cluster assembly ATPase SufC [Calditrichota bacterium]MBT7615916.1 Fe-S cluster assembly ATPase SufC [Calditrichota bacterium]
MLLIKDLHVNVGDIEILQGVNLEVPDGEIHALMGPNGSGKSTLANSLMGHPGYDIVSGEVTFDGKNVLDLTVDQRARLGLFMAFQYPCEIPGVGLREFLRTASDAVNKGKVSLWDFTEELGNAMESLQMDDSYLDRSLNEGFSGGEKKRAEILQMLILKPRLAILDETDSGLDVDALRIVAKGVRTLSSSRFSSLVITHYQRILDYLEPDKIHIFHNGKVALSGGPELAGEIDAHGYSMLTEETEYLTS